MKNRVSGEYAGISRLSERTRRTLGNSSSVSATKIETTDENGNNHIYMMQKHVHSFHHSDNIISVIIFYSSLRVSNWVSSLNYWDLSSPEEKPKNSSPQGPCPSGLPLVSGPTHSRLFGYFVAARLRILVIHAYAKQNRSSSISYNKIYEKIS